jgi:hypothetical protein
MSERGEVSDEADEDPEEPEKSKDVKSSIGRWDGRLGGVPTNPPYCVSDVKGKKGSRPE